MIGFDFAPAGRPAGEAGSAFMYACRRRGVHLTYAYGGVSVRIIPPLVITRSEIDLAVEVIEQAAAEVVSGASSAKDSLPSNPYTRRLADNPYWRRLLKYWWRSSPDEWLEKGRRKIAKQLGASSR
jgi:hypothetical protein